jgi:hypothetical protein
MNPKPLEISFTDSPQEEVALIRKEFNLGDAAQELEKAIMGGEVMSEEAHIKLAELLTAFREMFSVNLPELGDTAEETLRVSSRDINLSRLLRERGLVRLYRLIKERTDDGVPLFMSYLDPYGESPFKTQEEFVGWIAKDAHIPRSTLFMRFSTYDKMQGLGFDLENAFQTIITKPYAMRKVLNMTAEWNRTGQITSVNPDIVRKVARQVFSGEQAEAIVSYADYYERDPNPVALQELVQAYKPALKEFINELAAHQNTRDMMEHVQHDVLGKPEISYSWKDETLILSVIRKAVAEDGTEVILEIEDIPFVPDYPGKIEEAIIDDLLNRLPIKNRREILAERDRQALIVDDEELDKLPF